MIKHFEIGDRVKIISSFSRGTLGSVTELGALRCLIREDETRVTYRVKRDPESGTGLWFTAEELELVSRRGPVQIKTIATLIPGVYGKIMIYSALNKDVAVKFHVTNSAGNCVMTAEELRATAKTFNEIADYLDNKGWD